MAIFSCSGYLFAKNAFFEYSGCKNYELLVFVSVLMAVYGFKKAEIMREFVKNTPIFAFIRSARFGTVFRWRQTELKNLTTSARSDII